MRKHVGLKPRRRRPRPAPMPPISRGLQMLAWVSLGLAVVVLFGVWPLYGGDLVMHQVVGRWIWQHGGVPLTDPFSYVTAGREFIAHSWGSEVIFYLLERAAGTAGFSLLRLALISIALTFSLWTARLLQASYLSLMLVSPFVLSLLWARLEFRPQLVTTALLMVACYLVVSVHVGQRSRRWLWALPVMCLLAINLHGAWPTLVLQLAAVACARTAVALRGRWLPRAPISALPCRTLTLVLLTCGLMLWLNPYGLRLIVFPLEMQASWIRDLGSEWQNPFTSPGWDEVIGGRLLPMQPVFIVYVVLLAGVLVMTLRRWRTTDLIPMAFMSLWLLLGIWHLRAVSDMALITAPFVAAALPLHGWPLRRGVVLSWSGLLVGGAVLALLWTWGWVGSIHPAWWTQDEPVCAVATVARLSEESGRPLRVFGTKEQVWLLYRLPQRVLVNATWEYVSGSPGYRELLKVVSSQAALEAFLDRYHVDVVMLNIMVLRLTPRAMPKGWLIMHVDNRFVVLVRASAAWQGPRYHHIRSWEQMPVTLANASDVAREAEHALSTCGPEASFAWFYRTHALTLLPESQRATDGSRVR